MKKVSCLKTQNSFFADHFRSSVKIRPSLMYTTPLVPHVFSSFLFYQKLRIFKNYRAFRFKFPDKELISLRRFTISLLECRWFLKFCSFSFFWIRSAIAQQIIWDVANIAGKWYLRKMYILVALFIFDDSAMVVFKRRFSNCNGVIFFFFVISDLFTPYAYAPPSRPLNPGFYSMSGGCRNSYLFYTTVRHGK